MQIPIPPRHDDDSRWLVENLISAMNVMATYSVDPATLRHTRARIDEMMVEKRIGRNRQKELVQLAQEAQDTELCCPISLLSMPQLMRLYRMVKAEPPAPPTGR